MKILASILVIFFSYNLAFTQNCGTTTCSTFKYLSDKDYKKQLNKIDAIFYGEIVTQREIMRPEKEFPYRTLKVKVLRVWKGIDTNTKEIEIEFSYFDNDCAEIGAAGNRVFYAWYVKAKRIFLTGQCALSNYDDDKTKSILGEGKVVEQPQSEPPIEAREKSEGFWSGIWRKIVSFFA